MPLIPDSYYRPSARGCAQALTTLAAFGGGVYRGLCASHGAPVDPNLERLLVFGPSAASIPLAYSLGNQAINDPQMREKMPPVPQGAEGCYVGCSTVVTAGAIYAIHQAGFFVGSWLGKSTQ